MSKCDEARSEFRWVSERYLVFQQPQGSDLCDYHSRQSAIMLGKLSQVRLIHDDVMETFSALLALCVRNSPVNGEFLAQRPVTWSFDVFFYLRLNKRLSKQSGGWWFELTSRPLWRHCNVSVLIYSFIGQVMWFNWLTTSNESSRCVKW